MIFDIEPWVLYSKCLYKFYENTTMTYEVMALTKSGGRMHACRHGQTDPQPKLQIVATIYRSQTKIIVLFLKICCIGTQGIINASRSHDILSSVLFMVTLFSKTKQYFNDAINVAQGIYNWDVSIKITCFVTVIRKQSHLVDICVQLGSY